METVPQPSPKPSWGPLLGDLSPRPHQRLLGASCCSRPGDDRTGAAAWRQLALAQAAAGLRVSVFPAAKWDEKPLAATGRIAPRSRELLQLPQRPEQAPGRKATKKQGPVPPKGQGRGWRCPSAAELGSEPPRHHLPLTRETHHGFECRAWKGNKSSRSEGLKSAH